MITKTTVGQLVENLFAKYEDRYHDAKIAAVATEVIMADLMRTRRSGRKAG